MATLQFRVPSAEMQVRFWARLQQMRNQLLSESLSEAVRQLSIAALDDQLAEYVGQDRLQALAVFALRGETFYPVPYVLETKPLLLGYYRLLYGLSQKEFYKPPVSRFRALEERNQLSSANRDLLPNFCHALIQTGWELFKGIQPVSRESIHELQLLTIGPQLRGSENNVIGQQATRQVFDLIRSIIEPRIESATSSVITLKNAANRIVQVAFAADPDITIIETLPSGTVPSVSIEIKGGGVTSNVHNRLGEAEKSHQKARASGFTQFWTVLRRSVEEDIARRESPTTTYFFSLDKILSRRTPEHRRFRDRLMQVIGIGTGPEQQGVEG